MSVFVMPVNGTAKNGKFYVYFTIKSLMHLASRTKLHKKKNILLVINSCSSKPIVKFVEQGH